MTDGDERVRRLLDGEREGSPRLFEVLRELRDTDAGPLAEYLAVKEVEDRARVAHLDRQRWHRKLSWRLVQTVFFFGILSAVVFVAWGGEAAFHAAIFFVAGGTAYYLLTQAVLALRGRADDRALRDVEARCRAEYEALAERLG